MKIALIKNYDEPSWTSCKSITNNLVKLYSDGNSESKIFEVKNKESIYSISQAVKEIEFYKPDFIIYLEHNPSPTNFLALISNSDLKDKKIIYHVFGDFALQTRSWIDLFDKIKDLNIRFICASDAQKDFLLNILDTDCISVIPFPVDEKTFFYNQESRSQTRDDLNLSNSDFVYIYTGRLSIQKNIRTLLEVFSFFNDDKKLILCGSYDNLGRPYFGQSQLKDSYYFDLKELLNDKNVIYLGNRSAQELNHLYSASDCLINLSTHNDEDYGMSIAEAITSDLPVILTQWGGFKSFAKYSEKIRFISTSIKDQGIYPNFSESMKEIQSSLKTERITNPAFYTKSLSEKVKHELNSNFSNFKLSDNFHTLDNYLNNKTNCFFENGKISHEYKDLYEPYF